MKKRFLILLLAFAVIMGAAVFGYDYLTADYEMPTAQPQESSKPQSDESSSSQAQEKEPIPAPDFTVVDGEGNEVKLSDFFGKPIVLNFWASWCGPCKNEMPHFEKAYTEYGDKVNFVMVNSTDGIRETVDKASEYITGEGYTFPVYFDTQSIAAYTYGVSSLPSTLFIDADGNAIAGYIGTLSEKTLMTNIESLLEEK
ncbi:MAG: TlpA family protein disulfide reductase [Oscillospiraceae bacterium]|nr:TlpA family protein disulfide reductase [Oscillospiraceae bacterium]